MPTCRSLLPAALAVLFPGPLAAQPAHGWHPGYGAEATVARAEPQRKVDVETWRTADAPALLGHGRVAVSARDAAAQDPDAPPAQTPIEALPVFEAAVIDRLAAAGYDVANGDNPAQIAELTISRTTVVPPEPPHRPVSGEMSVGVSNRGAGYGFALAVDLTKPARAILATEIAVRIRDAASKRVLWEGHARSEARDGEPEAGTDAWAQRLTRALFARFPEGAVVPAMPGVE